MITRRGRTITFFIIPFRCSGLDVPPRLTTVLILVPPRSLIPPRTSHVLFVELLPFVGFIPPRSLESVTPSFSITVVSFGELDRARITSTLSTITARRLEIGILRHPDKLTWLLRILRRRPKLRTRRQPSSTSINDDINRVDGVIAVDNGFG